MLFLHCIFHKVARMKRIKILTAALLMTMTVSASPIGFGTPTEGEPASAIAPEGQEISLSVSGSTIRVTGAAKLTLTAYYVTGAKAASYTIETEDQTISTNLAKGIYLLKVGQLVRKVSIS